MAPLVRSWVTSPPVLLFHQAHLLFPRVCPEHTFCGVQNAVPPSIRPPRLYAYARFDKVCLSVPRLNRNSICISLIYNYLVLFVYQFDTIKFPQ